VARALLSVARMTFRIEVAGSGGAARIVFCGLLDRAAFEALEDAVRTLAAHSAGAVVVLLAEGTEAFPECVAALAALPAADVRAEAPFLARWIASARGHGA
jgi:hypothetical protein